MPAKNKSARIRNKPKSGKKEAIKLPKRTDLLTFLEDSGKPVTFSHLAKSLNVDAEGRSALRNRLAAMIRDGQIIRNRRGAYGLSGNMDLLAGTISAHADGYGFLIPEEGGDDIYLSPKQMRRVLHRDRALICITGLDSKGRKEGAIVEVLERAHSQIVGRFVEESGVALVVPDDPRVNQDVMIPLEHTLGAQPGQIVVAKLRSQPSYHQPPIGHVTEILGQEGEASLAVEIVIRNFDLPHKFSERELEQAAAFGDTVPAQQIKGRKDLRQLPLVTIDGADARDFDDAVYCRRQQRGYQLIVAIADVSSYVRPGDALDDAALQRGVSVYFPSRVLPMLPEDLSNGLCSLKPAQDRLCLACEISLDQHGKVTRSRFYAAVMHSKARLTYDQAWAMLNGSAPELRDRDAAVTDSLDALYQLYKLLRQRRERRGALDFRSHDVRVLFDQDSQVEDIVPYHRNDAHKLIEECMVLANVQAAKFLQRRKIPALYRLHQPPPAEKLEKLEIFLRGRGIPVSWRQQPKPEDLSRLLTRIREREDADLVEAVVLRSLSLAVYHAENASHFGLALEAYAHFTSPIRRYPDLLVHRAIHHILQRREISSYGYSQDQAANLASRCSMLARRAEEAERDVKERLKCAYMEHKVGEEFSGTVTGVTSFGLFVELDGNQVSGLVHITALPNDYYHFDPLAHKLSGDRRGYEFQLADRVAVRVAAVNMEERKVDFEWIGFSDKAI